MLKGFWVNIAKNSKVVGRRALPILLLPTASRVWGKEMSSAPVVMVAKVGCTGFQIVSNRFRFVWHSHEERSRFLYIERPFDRHKTSVMTCFSGCFSKLWAVAGGVLCMWLFEENWQLCSADLYWHNPTQRRQLHSFTMWHADQSFRPPCPTTLEVCNLRT